MVHLNFKPWLNSHKIKASLSTHLLQVSTTCYGIQARLPQTNNITVQFGQCGAAEKQPYLTEACIIYSLWPYHAVGPRRDSSKQQRQNKTGQKPHAPVFYRQDERTI